MADLPTNYETSWTLASSVSRKGVCLHSGENVEVNLHPYEKEGFHVSWSNSKEGPHALKIEQVRHSQLCTTLQIGPNRLSTVEHLLAALAGHGITHVHIEVSGNEIPLLDGSALCWVEAIQEAGIKHASTPRRASYVLEKPLILHQGDSVITATPADKFNLIGVIDFPYPVIGQQMFNIQLTPELFIKEIAPARTFGFSDQVEELMSLGLIKGGGLKNALVCDGNRWLNPPLRFDNEPVRHKLLDLIGDLALVGFPKAQVLVYKGSHRLHNDFSLALIKACSKPGN